jgi:Abortive infection alpha
MNEDQSANDAAPEPEDEISPAYEASEDASLMRSMPSLVRIAGAAYWRSARWTMRTSARAGSRVIRAALTGQEPAELFRSTGAEMRERARRVLGIPDPRHEAEPEMTPEAVEAVREEARQSLRERGAELLRRSADVNFDEDSHPAYTRILEDLAPDEGRILRLLAQQGPQPSVDIRSGWVPLKSASELIASGLNMIGAEAGCRHLDDIPAYLNNLFRLGLIWFSREPLSDPLAYQVLEAQPDVAKALSSTGHTRTVRRSIGLTPFGRSFCELCLPLDTAEFEALGSGGPSAGQVGEPDLGEQGDGRG